MYTSCPSYDQLLRCYLLFERSVFCVETMEDADFRRFLESRATNERRQEILLDESIRPYDKQARYWLLSEILSWNKETIPTRQCVLYESREEAQQALLPPPIVLEPKRQRKVKRSA